MKSATLRANVIDKVLGRASWNPANHYYIALYTAAPTEYGGGTEVSGGGYARVQVDNNHTTFPLAVDGVKSNGVSISFPTAIDAWGTIVAFGVHDHATNDALVIWGPLDASMVISATNTPVFAPGSIIFEEL